MKLRLSRTSALLPLSVALAMAGCAPAPRPLEPATASTTLAAPVEATQLAKPSGDKHGGLDVRNLPAPLASVTTKGTTRDKKPSTLKVDLLQAERRDRLVYLAFALTPSGDTAAQRLSDWLGYGPNPYLRDRAGLKLYRAVDVATSPSVRGLATSAFNVFPPDQVSLYFAVVAAPPAGVATVDVSFVDAAAPFQNVALS